MILPTDTSGTSRVSDTSGMPQRRPSGAWRKGPDRADRTSAAAGLVSGRRFLKLENRDREMMLSRVRLLLVWAVLGGGTASVWAGEVVPVSHLCPNCPPEGAVVEVGDPWAAVQPGSTYVGSYSPYYQHLPVGPDGIVTERLPEDLGGLYGESPLDAYLKSFAKNLWVRLEYLHWDYERPGDTTLGAPVLGVRDPREPFPVTVGTNLAGFAHVPSLGSLNLRDNQGLRATLGIPLTVGSVELSIFSFEEGRTGMAEDMGDPRVGATLQNFIATSTYTDGEIGHNLFLYDRYFSADFTSDFWGGEANFIFDPLVPGPGFKLRPLIGFHFFDLEERLMQHGVYDQNGFLTTPLISTIDSTAKNRIYAPQIGLRFEYVSRWFTVGVEPKMVFGINVYKDRVVTDDMRSFADPVVLTEKTGTKFAPIGDFEVNGRVHLTRSFSVFVSYHILVAAGISRPQNNIYYDDHGPNAPQTAIVVRPSFDNMVIQGLSVGGELRFR